MQNKQVKVSSIGEIEKYWDHMTDIYLELDPALQTFYYCLANMLKLDKATNILEVGCGTAKLIPYTISIKNANAQYHAFDLSPEMVKLAQHVLTKNIKLYSENLTLQNWCAQHKLTVQQGNCQEQLGVHKKFDRIICNLVLQITEKPQKMLQSLFNQSQKGCILGVTVWGERSLNMFFNQIGETAKQLGIFIPASRSNHHLCDTVDKLIQDNGWQIIIAWNQNVSIPFIQQQQTANYVNFSVNKMKLSQEDSKVLKQKVLEKMGSILSAKKNLNFSARLVIAKRK